MIDYQRLCNVDTFKTKTFDLHYTVLGSFAITGCSVYLKIFYTRKFIKTSPSQIRF